MGKFKRAALALAVTLAGCAEPPLETHSGGGHAFHPDTGSISYVIHGGDLGSASHQVVMDADARVTIGCTYTGSATYSISFAVPDGRQAVLDITFNSAAPPSLVSAGTLRIVDDTAFAWDWTAPAECNIAVNVGRSPTDAGALATRIDGDFNCFHTSTGPAYYVDSGAFHALHCSPR